MILSALHKRRGTHPDGHRYRLGESSSLLSSPSLSLTSTTSTSSITFSNNVVVAVFMAANSMQCCLAASLSIITL